MSCSRLSIRHRYALRLPLQCQPRKMMQSWLHHHRPTTHNLRHRPAPYLRSAQRPSMASRLMARCNLGSSSLFTGFLPPSKPAASQLLTMHSAPEDVIKHYTWTSDQPHLYLKQSPTTTTLASLIKWANHPSRLNGNKSLESMSTQLFQARQRTPKGDAPTFAASSSVGTGAWLHHQAH